jgi:hypothetical protein
MNKYENEDKDKDKDESLLSHYFEQLLIVNIPHILDHRSSVIDHRWKLHHHEESKLHIQVHLQVKLDLLKI